MTGKSHSMTLKALSASTTVHKLPALPAKGHWIIISSDKNDEATQFNEFELFALAKELDSCFCFARKQ